MVTGILWVFKGHLFCYQQHEQHCLWCFTPTNQKYGFYCNIFLNFVVFCAQVCVIVDENTMPWMRVGLIREMLLSG